MKFIVLSIFVLIVTQTHAKKRNRIYLHSIVDNTTNWPGIPYPDIPLDVLFKTKDADYAPLPVYGYDIYDSETGVPIPTDLIVCQAFRDEGGKRPLGKPFKNDPAKNFIGPLAPGPYGTQRFSSILILPGSILCSDAAGIKAYLKSRPANGIPVVKAVPRRYVQVISIQDPDSARYFADQVYVLVDDTVHPFSVKAEYVFSYVSDGNPPDDWVRTRCQFYEDKKGTKSIGPRFNNYTSLNKNFTGDDPNYAPSKVRSIKCHLLSPEELLLEGN